MSATNSPHPLLRKARVLYVVDPPSHIKWTHIVQTFKPCGPVTSASADLVAGAADQHCWAVQFRDTYYAEMALATLQGQPFVCHGSPPVAMMLSHSPTSKDCIFPNRFSQYVKSAEQLFQGQLDAAQLAFRCFRTAGPLATVRVDEDVGQRQTITIQYFEEKHARSARLRLGSLHKKLRNKAFTLITYDPCSLHCSGFGPSSLRTNSDLENIFRPYGILASSSLRDIGQPNMHGIVTFVSSSCASQALKVNGKKVGCDTLIVRYHEPPDQNAFRQPPASSNATSNVDPRKTAEDAARAKEEQLRREAIAQELREAAARQAQEAAAREAAEAKVKKAKERQRRKEEAARVCTKASQDLKAARTEGHDALRELVAAKNAQEKVDREWEKAQEACAEAKRIWLESMDRSVAAKARTSVAQEAVSNALQRKLQADRNIKVAEHEEASSRAEKEELEAGASDEEFDEETLRQAELAESIRRIRELREMEEAEKEEKAQKERKAGEERVRRELKEAERVAREQREREERERREAEAKKREEETKRKLYNQAVAKEQERCRLRDARLCPVFLAWHDQLAFERFKLVSDEFDSLKFHESQPLTFKSVPWPLLVRPTLMTFDAIDWSAVEKFFDAVENLLEDQAKYKAFVEKAHRRFHPDKWRARGILNSVQDEELRGRMEAAGNVVAQAITPLWLKSRQ